MRVFKFFIKERSVRTAIYRVGRGNYWEITVKIKLFRFLRSLFRRFSDGKIYRKNFFGPTIPVIKIPRTRRKNVRISKKISSAFPLIFDLCVASVYIYLEVYHPKTRTFEKFPSCPEICLSPKFVCHVLNLDSCRRSYQIPRQSLLASS